MSHRNKIHSKDGRRAKGIYAKSGKLYMVVSKVVGLGDNKKTKKDWLPTNLDDTPPNVKKAQKQREKMITTLKLSEIDKEITVSDYIDAVLQKCKRQVKDTTYSSYCNRSKIIKKYFGTKKIRAITEKNLEDFLDNLFEIENYAVRYVTDIQAFTKIVFRRAIDDGVICYNPAKDVVMNKNLASRHARDSSDDDFFSYEEAIDFLRIVENDSLYELYYVALFFGMRREEVLGLRWCDVDLDRDPKMKIRHTVTKGTEVNYLNEVKTEMSKRDYPLSDEHVRLFKHLKKKENQFRELLGDKYIVNDYIFKNNDGSLYYPDTLSKKFRKIIKSNKCLPQGITFRGLRTSCVSIMVHEGKDIKVIQAWVGHSDIKTTLAIYAKVKTKMHKKQLSDEMSMKIQVKSYE